MIVFSLIIILYLVFFGVNLSYFFKLKFFLEERVVIGLLLALVFFSFLMLGVVSILGLTVLSLGIVLVGMYLLTLINLNQKIYDQFLVDWRDFLERAKVRSWQIFFGVLVILSLVFGYLASQLMTFDKGYYFVQPVHSYGDISLHLAMISSFAYGGNFPPESPILYGAKISYPFIVDFLTAVFVNPLGLRFDQAVSLTGVLLMIILVVSLAYFGLHLTKSKLAGVIFLLLVFFNGGFGFVNFITDFLGSNNSFWQFITHLSKDYTSLKDIGYWWINVVLSAFLPQRSTLLGIPLALLILRIFIELKDILDYKKLLLGVLLIGFLPVIHSHSLIALAPILLYLGLVILFENWAKKGSIIVLGIFCVSVALFFGSLFLQQTQKIDSLFRVQFWWMAHEENPFVFYVKNFGAVLYVILPMLYWLYRRRSSLLPLGLIAQIWFILPSIFLFAPWEYDNTKLFLYWYIISAALIAYFLAVVFQKGWWQKLVVIPIILLFTTSGFIDVFRLFSGFETKYQIYSPQAIRLANYFISQTPKKSVVLSVDKFDNPVVSLAGRRTILGYRGWVWTYGLNYYEQERDVKAMLTGKADRSTFEKYHVRYVVLFPEKHDDYPINSNYFKENFKLFYGKDGYFVYQL